MRTQMTETPSRIPWPPLLLASTIGGGWWLGRAQPLAWPGLDDTAARHVGIGIGIAGIALAVSAIVVLHRAGTTVRPDAAASALVTHGPFRRLRNPIYVADVMILLGIAELTKNVWLAILAIPFVLLVTWLAILPEEAHLEARFGDAYRDYKARTRRWI